MSIARHTSYNLIGAIVPVVTSLITVPFYLQAIGLDRYGVLSICWLLVGYFNIFDFGLGRATARRIAALEGGPAEQRSKIFWTSAALSAVLSLIAMILFLPLASFGLRLIDLPNATLTREVNASLPLLVMAVPFGIARSLLVGSLQGRAEFLRINLIESVGTVATAIIPLLAALLISPRLSILIVATLLVRMIVILFLALHCARAIPVQRPQLSDRADRRSLLAFGGWTTVSNVVSPLLSLFDRFIIGSMRGAASVALYVVPFNVISQLTMVPYAASTAIFTRMATLPPREAGDLNRDALTTLACIVTPMSLIAAALIEPFFQIWLGAGIASRTLPVAYILLIGMWANSLATVPFVRLQAQGSPKLIAIAHLVEIPPYVALLYFGLTHLGIAGAALAWSARCVADAVVLGVMAKTEWSVMRKLLRHAILASSAIGVAWMWPTSSMVRWLTLGLIALATAIVVVRDVPLKVASQLRGFVRRRSVASGH